MSKVKLYEYRSPELKVTIEAYFNNEELVIEGYDIGSRVNDYWGDSDYEYSTTVPEQEVNKLYPLLNVVPGDKEGLLKAIAERFNDNRCFSRFNDFLEENGVESGGFSWT